MARVEFALRFTLPAESLHEFTSRIQLEHIIGAVTVCDINVAIGSDGYRAWFEFIGVFVEPTLLWETDRPNGIPVQFKFDDFVIRRASAINKFFTVLFTYFHPMNAGRSHCPEEFSCRRKHHHASR